MAASLMCCGVGKCGSPAPKSTSLAPWARSFAASAATAMVAETSIRPIRSAKTFCAAATVIVLLSLQILRFASNNRLNADDFLGIWRVRSLKSGRVQFLTDRDHGVGSDKPSAADETSGHVLDIGATSLN